MPNQVYFSLASQLQTVFHFGAQRGVSILMMEKGGMGDFATRLKQEFEDRDFNASDSDESQDWFVNDSPKNGVLPNGDGKSSLTYDGTKEGTTVHGSARLARSVSTPQEKTIRDEHACDTYCGPMAFLHYVPSTYSVFVMELARGIEVPRYGTKSFRLYIPQVHEHQTDYCVYARKRRNKLKYRFRQVPLRKHLVDDVFTVEVDCSLDEQFTTSWSDSMYEGKVLMTPSTDTKRFRVLATKSAGRAQFDIKQEPRKQELSVRITSTTNRLRLFRARSTLHERQNDLFCSHIQNFINPIVDVRCSRTNYTLFKMEREGVRVVS